MSGRAAARGVVSIQSHVAYGHVGNSAAVFALQRLGHEVWPVNVLAYSNHPGYGTHAGTVHAPALVREIVDGLECIGALDTCSAVLTGYLPSTALVGEAGRAIDRVRAANPGAPCCCDPVIRDRETGRYVPDGVAEAIRETLVPRADLLAPNVFELERLTGARVQGMPDAFTAAAALRAAGPARVVVTGLGDDDGRMASALVDESGAWLASVPRIALDRRPDGAGDLLVAVLLARLLDGAPAPEALAHAMAVVHDLLALTVERGARELCLVEGQALLARPVSRAEVVRVG